MSIKKMSGRVGAIAIAVAIAVVVMASGVSAQTQWKWTKQDSRTTKNLRSVVWGKSPTAAELFVAVGDDGTIITSANGEAWTVRNSGVSATLHTVMFRKVDLTAGDLFVAGGDNGTIITSPNGVNWTVVSSGKDYTIGSIAHGNDKFVAFASKHPDVDYRILTFDKYFGEPVSTIISGYMSSPALMKVAYGNGIFIGGNTDENIRKSTDGVRWERGSVDFYPCSGDFALDPCGPPFVQISCPVLSAPRPMRSIAYAYAYGGGGVFLALGDGGARARTENGSTWKLIEPSCNRCPANGHAVIHDGTRFVIAGQGGVFFTDNGDNLEQIFDKPFGSGVSIAGSGSLYVTVDGTELGTLAVATRAVHPGANKSAPAQFVRITGSTLKVSLPACGKVEIYALTGAKVRKLDMGAGTHALRLNNLPRGTYVVSAESGAWRQSVRMVVR